MTNRYQSSVSLLMKRVMILPCLLCMMLPMAWSQTPIHLTISGIEVQPTKVYDGTRTAGLADPGIIAGIVDGDDVQVTRVARYATANVGTIIPVTISFNLSGTDAANYVFDTVIYTYAAITAKPLYMTGVSVQDTRIYDGYTHANVSTYGQLVGVVGDENVNATREAHYLDANVGEDKPVEVRYRLYDYSDTPGDTIRIASLNYIAPAYDTFYADITAKQLGVLANSVSLDTTKVYDQTTLANVSNSGELVGVVGTDIVMLTATANYDTNAVGDNKPITVEFALSGLGSSNYLAPHPMTYSGSITPKDITIDSFQITPTKVYNGKRLNPIVNGGVLRGVYEGDTVTCTSLALYNTAKVGYMKTVEVTHTLGGTHAANYNLVDNTIYTADITPRQLYAHGIEVQKVKLQDGNGNAAIIVEPVLDSLVEGDTVELSAVAAYEDAKTGHDKDIYVDYTIAGPQIENYIEPADVLYCNDGIIIDTTTIYNGDVAEGGMFQFGVIGGDDNSFHSVNTTEPFYCQGTNAGLQYVLTAGEPDIISLDFDDAANAQGFADAQVSTGFSFPMSYPYEGVIGFNVPENCKEGRYGLVISFITNAVNYTVKYDTVWFNVNLSNGYLRQLFCDVISIDNSGKLDGQPNRFHTYQWFHNGEEIEGATKAYYQDPEGLNGEYVVLVNQDSVDQHYVCALTELENCPEDKIIHIYPNPIKEGNTTNIELEGFEEGTHTLFVTDRNGYRSDAVTFEGTKYELDLTGMAAGVYFVNVDGVAAKVIKL